MADARTKFADGSYAMGRTHNLIEPSLSQRYSPWEPKLTGYQNTAVYEL